MHALDRARIPWLNMFIRTYSVVPSSPSPLKWRNIRGSSILLMRRTKRRSCTHRSRAYEISVSTLDYD
jgi:hypothetical protein